MNAPEIQSKNMKIKTLAAAKSYVLRIKKLYRNKWQVLLQYSKQWHVSCTPCSCYMECKESPEQPLLHGQRPRFKEAEFNRTETATACFLLYPAEFISTYLCSPDLTLDTLISVRTTCCKESNFHQQ